MVSALLFYLTYYIIIFCKLKIYNILGQKVGMEELTNDNINKIVNDYLYTAIIESLNKNKEQIENSVDECIKETIVSNKLAYFKESLDWAVEYSVREGFSKVIKELNMADLIAQKIRTLLSDDDFIKSLAEWKIKSSLGMPIS